MGWAAGAWRAADIQSKKSFPKPRPRLNGVLRLIGRPPGRRAGFRGCKGDGEPGLKAIWRGLPQVMDFAEWTKCASKANEL